MKIIFLDFDGVISTNRAWIAQKHINHHDMRWLDPIACAMLAEICEKYDYKLVVSSTWRKFGLDRIRECLDFHGLWKFVHDEWRTDEIWPKGPYASAGSRPAEIADWLARYPECKDYLILDDDQFMWTDEQLAKWIKTDQLNGFSTQDFEAIINRNETCNTTNN